MYILSCCISLFNMHMLHKYQHFVNRQRHTWHLLHILYHFSEIRYLVCLMKFVCSAKCFKICHIFFSNDTYQKFLCFRCVSCKCMDCPLTAATSGVVINPPLTFVIDTTRSVKPDKDSIFNLTQRVVDRIQETNTNIPQVRQH